MESAPLHMLGTILLPVPISPCLGLYGCQQLVGSDVSFGDVSCICNDLAGFYFSLEFEPIARMIFEESVCAGLWREGGPCQRADRLEQEHPGEHQPDGEVPPAARVVHRGQAE